MNGAACVNNICVPMCVQSTRARNHQSWVIDTDDEPV